ncbi:PEP-CTERM sorting domain-containing protein [Planctomycetota bacterium]
MRSTKSANKMGACLLTLAVLLLASTSWGTFIYDPIPEADIVSATFSVDFASLVAHRSVSGFETNFAKLLDLSAGLPEYDFSDDLFGTAAYPGTPEINMGSLETNVFTADIDPSFFPALATGEVGMHLLFTDTDDGLFAIDFISLTIETSTETVEAYHGWPIGGENDGFGLGIPDGGNLPNPMPGALEPTGTGFDEELTSKVFYEPEPTSVLLLGVGALALLRRRQRSVTHKPAPKTTTKVTRQAMACPLSFILLILITITFMQNVSIAGDKDWTGEGVDTKWNTPGNWDPAGVPGKSDNVTIPENSGIISVDVKVHVNSLTIDSSDPGIRSTTLTGDVATEGLSITTTGNLSVGANSMLSGDTNANNNLEAKVNINCKGDLTVDGKIKGGKVKTDKGNQGTGMSPKVKIKADNLDLNGNGKIDGATGQSSNGDTEKYENSKHDASNGGDVVITLSGNLTMQDDTSINGGKPGEPAVKYPYNDVADQGTITVIIDGKKVVKNRATLSGRRVVTKTTGGLAQMSPAPEDTILATNDVYVVADDPGGVIDFTGNPAGIAVIRAGTAINVYASQVLLDPGVTLADITDPPADVLDETPFEDPDQVHIIGPVPNMIAAGRQAPIQASVQNGFVGIPGEEVVFKKIAGDFNFNTAFLSPDGTEATFTTDADGIAEVWIDANGVSEALVEVTVMGPELPLSAYSFFDIVPCPLVADMDGYCDVDFVDFSLFALHWLEAGCGDCGGADFTGDGNVDFADVKVMGLSWLEGLE